MNTCAWWEEGTPRRGASGCVPHLTLTPWCPIAMLLKLGGFRITGGLAETQVSWALTPDVMIQ